MNLKVLLSKMTAFNLRIKDYGYFILLLAVGMLAVIESTRITAKYAIKDWISGPSGFVMIVGCALLCLAIIEGLSLLKAKRSKSAQVPPPTRSLDQTLESSPGLVSGEDLNLNKQNVYITYALLIIYVLTIKPLGFTISTAIYLTLNMLMLKNSWLLTLVTVVLTIACTMFGAPAMGLSLPRGIFGF